MARPKVAKPLSHVLGPVRVSDALFKTLKRVQRQLVREAGGEHVTIAEVQRRLMLRGLAATPEAPPLSSAVDGALGS